MPGGLSHEVFLAILARPCTRSLTAIADTGRRSGEAYKINSAWADAAVLSEQGA